MAASSVVATTTATGWPKQDTCRMSYGSLTPPKSVRTRSTSRSRTAAAGSMRCTLPRAMVLHTNAAYTRSGAGLSAA